MSLPFDCAVRGPGIHHPLMQEKSHSLFKQVWRVLERTRGPSVCEDVCLRLIHRLGVESPFCSPSLAAARSAWTRFRGQVRAHFTSLDPADDLSPRQRLSAWLRPSCRWRCDEYALALLEEINKRRPAGSEETAPPPSGLTLDPCVGSPSRSPSGSPAATQARSTPSPSGGGWALLWLDALRDGADATAISQAWRGFLRAARAQRLIPTEWPQLLSRLAHAPEEQRQPLIAELVRRSRPTQLQAMWETAVKRLKKPEEQIFLVELGRLLARAPDRSQVLEAVADWAPIEQFSLLEALAERQCVRRTWMPLVERADVPVTLRILLLQQSAGTWSQDLNLARAVRRLLEASPAAGAAEALEILLTIRPFLERVHLAASELLPLVRKALGAPEGVEAIGRLIADPACDELMLMAALLLVGPHSPHAEVVREALAARPRGLGVALRGALLQQLRSAGPAVLGGWTADLFSSTSFSKRKVTAWKELVLDVLREDGTATAALLTGLTRVSRSACTQLALELARHDLEGESPDTQSRIFACWLSMHRVQDEIRDEELPRGWAELQLPADDWAADLVPVCSRFQSAASRAEPVWYDAVESVTEPVREAQRVASWLADRKATELAQVIEIFLDQAIELTRNEAELESAEDSLFRRLLGSSLVDIGDFEIAVRYGRAVDRFMNHLLARTFAWIDEAEQQLEQIDRGELDLFQASQPAGEATLRDPRQAKPLAVRLILSPRRLAMISKMLHLCWQHPDLAPEWLKMLTIRLGSSSKLIQEIVIPTALESFTSLDSRHILCLSASSQEAFWSLWSMTAPRESHVGNLLSVRALLQAELVRVSGLDSCRIQEILHRIGGLSLAVGLPFEMTLKQWAALKSLFLTIMDLSEVLPDCGSQSLIHWRRLTRQCFSAALLVVQSADVACRLAECCHEAMGLMHSIDRSFADIIPISLICEGLMQRKGLALQPLSHGFASEALDEWVIRASSFSDQDALSSLDCWILCLRAIVQYPHMELSAPEQLAIGALVAALGAHLNSARLDHLLAEFLADEVHAPSNPECFQPLWKRLPLYAEGALRVEGIKQRIDPERVKALAPLSDWMAARLREALAAPSWDATAIAAEWRAAMQPRAAKLLGGHLLREASVEPDLVKQRERVRFALNVMVQALQSSELLTMLTWLRQEPSPNAMLDADFPCAALVADPAGEALRSAL